MIVRLQGGLGNQFFQYAFALRMAKRGYDVALDAIEYNKICLPFSRRTHDIEQTKNARELELRFFNISLPILNFSPQPLSMKNFLFYKVFFYRLINKLRLRRCYDKFFYIVDSYAVRQKILNNYHFSSQAYFIGFFTNPKFFCEFRDNLLSDFSLKAKLNKENKAIKERILNMHNATFLHIRRGDYLWDKNWDYVKLGKAYYEGALKALKTRLKKATIFIFSDDIKWCKEHFLESLSLDAKKDLEFVFVNSNSEAHACFELDLMRSAKHAIMANSSFSWWAAYLIENPQKVVTVSSAYSYNPQSLPWSPQPLEYIKIDYIWGNEA